MDTLELFPWLNRIGIILNFFAGFMLAPELIGLERLIRLEGKLENLFTSLKNFSEQAYSFMPIPLRGELGAIDMIKVFMGVMGVFGFIFCGIPYLIYMILEVSSRPEMVMENPSGLILFSCMFIIVLVTIIISVYIIVKAEMITLSSKGGIRKVIKEYFEVLLIAAYTPFILVYAIISFTLLKTTAFVVKTLEGNERLRSIFVAFGIFLFILGNLLQLIATF